jgi:hypothetical protein
MIVTAAEICLLKLPIAAFAHSKINSDPPKGLAAPTQFKFDFAKALVLNLNVEQAGAGPGLHPGVHTARHRAGELLDFFQRIFGSSSRFIFFGPTDSRQIAFKFRLRGNGFLKFSTVRPPPPGLATRSRPQPGTSSVAGASTLPAERPARSARIIDLCGLYGILPSFALEILPS